MLRTDALEYDLPDDLVATRPCEPRDAARLLVVSRDRPERHETGRVRDLPRFLREGDLLVFNDSRVLPARLAGVRRNSGGRISGLFLREREDGRWEVMLKSNGRLRSGDAIDLVDAHDAPTGRSLTLVDRAEEGWVVDPADEHGARVTATECLARVGATPLPPYILGARQRRSERVDDEADRAWYQTVYAQSAERAASVAAPTAGLHFTPALLDTLASKGVSSARVTLHVGAGTFKPVETETVETHPIHAEWAEVPADTLRAAARTRAAGGRVVCIGTTSARALESAPVDTPDGQGWLGETRLLITPGYRWRRLDGLMTNFHLPRSTLLAMVAALFPQGVSDLLPLYRHAVRERFRFYSYGDAMLILPGVAEAP
ncbi:MAG: tRNA preQ1(34) S-adenosylmethionine ribosyltransferase-isomerase QueA [Phycisphaerales bacterium]